MKKISKFIDELIDRAIPRKESCLSCGAEEDVYENYLCDECFSNIKFVVHNCLTCGRMIDNITIGKCRDCLETHRQKLFEEIYSAIEFNDFSIKLLYRYKYDYQRYLMYVFSSLLERKIRDKNMDIDIIVPLVSGDKRVRSRGFDHVDSICNLLSQSLNIKKLKLLKRKKHSKAFHNLPQNIRAELIENAFEYIDKKMQEYIAENHVYNSRKLKILLVDDVYTTGATMREAFKTLEKHHSCISAISILHS